MATQFRILGSDYKAVLLEHIDADCLPVEYGGTCECGRTLEAGQPVAERCVTPPCTLSLEEMLALANVERFELVAGASCVRSVEVVVGSNSIWHLSVASNDVGFSVRFVPTSGDGEAQIVCPESLVKRHKGHFAAREPGRLEVAVSNKHSRFKSKEVLLRLTSGHSDGECRIRELTLFSNPAELSEYDSVESAE